MHGRAVEAVLTPLRSATFDPTLLVEAEGVEALLLAAARRQGVERSSVAPDVPRALVQLAARCRAGVSSPHPGRRCAVMSPTHLS